MIPCPHCGRHVFERESACPFCEAEITAPSPLTSSPVGRKFMTLLGAAVTPIVLTACYGVGGFETGEEDRDGDGWFAPGDDCNDDDENVNPDADEVCDDEIDNDCDGAIDGDDTDCAEE